MHGDAQPSRHKNFIFVDFFLKGVGGQMGVEVEIERSKRNGEAL